ncbi:MAG: bifunctional nuclease family protein [Deltaproteobacteria bacterium]|nr:bifunctional nuclease family protein [Deltaproteobacteria bacterium]
MSLVSLSVQSFALDPRDGKVVVVFVDAAGRHLPMWVDDVDAATLADASRGELDTARSTPALLLAAVEACGGAVERVELRRLERGVLHGAVILDGARGAAELPAKASLAAALALLAGAPVLAEDAIVAHVDARVREAAARAVRAERDTGADSTLALSTAERWSQTLLHLAGKLHDERRS